MRWASFELITGLLTFFTDNNYIKFKSSLKINKSIFLYYAISLVLFVLCRLIGITMFVYRQKCVYVILMVTMCEELAFYSHGKALT